MPSGREVEAPEAAQLEKTASSNATRSSYRTPPKQTSSSHVVRELGKAVSSSDTFSLHSTPPKKAPEKKTKVKYTTKVKFEWGGPFYPGYYCASGIGGVDDAFAGNLFTSLAYCKLMCEKDSRCTYITYYNNPDLDPKNSEGPPSRCRMSETCYVREKTPHGPTEIFAKEAIEIPGEPINETVPAESAVKAGQETMAQTIGVLFLIFIVVVAIIGISMLKDDPQQGADDPSSSGVPADGSNPPGEGNTPDEANPAGGANPQGGATASTTPGDASGSQAPQAAAGAP